MKNSIPTDNIEFFRNCKAIQQKMKEDIHKYDEKQIIKSIESSKSLKHARQKQYLGKGQLISIKEEDGTHFLDKAQKVKKCVKFRKVLYK